MPLARIVTGATLAISLASPAAAQVQATPDHVGDALQYIVPLAAAGMSWYHSDLAGAKQLGMSFVAAQGTTEVLKHVVHSPRPDRKGHGFPSGHTSAVFSAAGFVHERYGIGEAWPFYILAIVTGYERVHHEHHTTGQVVGGAVVGLGSAFIFTKPLPDGGRVGVAWERGPWLTYAKAW